MVGDLVGRLLGKGLGEWIGNLANTLPIRPFFVPSGTTKRVGATLALVITDTSQDYTKWGLSRNEEPRLLSGHFTLCEQIWAKLLSPRHGGMINWLPVALLWGQYQFPRQEHYYKDRITVVHDAPALPVYVPGSEWNRLLLF